MACLTTTVGLTNANAEYYRKTYNVKLTSPLFSGHRRQPGSQSAVVITACIFGSINAFVHRISCAGAVPSR
ncbi:hypothetical protein C9I89_06750 [Photobacterium lipolyticum]|uniref:Uncharacterized protein n=1 Tax=Photobacterium lipolyticum TaxID=266810 RepID=A0A2T3N1J8_9GAMM|nr:hypothetical protein C9I89_06750 [Photobacterium lipolyticum]